MKNLQAEDLPSLPALPADVIAMLRSYYEYKLSSMDIQHPAEELVRTLDFKAGQISVVEDLESMSE